MPTIGYTSSTSGGGTKPTGFSKTTMPQLTTAAQAAISPVVNQTPAGPPTAGAGMYAPSGTSGASAGTPTPGLPAQGSNPYSGFASQYNPGALQEQIWSDPQMVLNTMFQQSGAGQNNPMYATMRNFYNADPQSFFYLMRGGGNAGQLSAGDYANFLNSLYSSYMQPGGRALSFNELLSNLTNVPDQSGLGAQDQSPLYQLLTAGNASDQGRTTYGLLSDAAKATMSPTMASAFQNALANEVDRYLAANGATPGGAQPFYQYFQNPMGQ